MSEVTLTSANFKSEVYNSEIPVIVDFWATWCGPCRMLAPTIAEIASENVGKIKVCKVNVDDEPTLADEFGIVSIPTIIAFKNGAMVGKLIGWKQKSDILAMIK